MNQALMTSDLSHDFVMAVLEYQSLEQKVNQLVVQVCKPFCSTCSNCCCKIDFCSESFDSYWLRMTWELSGYSRSQYDDSIGWLSSDGCRLTTGRPPVCYEHLCNRIISETPDDRLDGVKGVSRLLSSAGKNALGNRHLITLSSEQILSRMNFSKLRRQIAQSLHLFQKYEPELPTL
jgi:hypothetical protein